MTLEDVRDTWIASGFVKDDTWNIEHFRMSPVFKKLKVHLDNVFEGSREMSKHLFKYNSGFYVSIIFSNFYITHIQIN